MFENARYFVGTQVECQSIIDRIDSSFGWPDKNTRTYAESIMHDADQTKFMVVVDSGMEGHKGSMNFNKEVTKLLLSSEKSKFATRASLRASNAFAIMTQRFISDNKKVGTTGSPPE